MASTPENSLLLSGLAALKQGKYQYAIAQLEQVRQLELDQTLVERAIRGLIVAYSQVGDIEKAIADCQILTHSSNPQNQEWANQTLAKLSQTTATQNATGFTSLPADNTGFAPLTPSQRTPRTRFQGRKEKKGSTIIAAQSVSPQPPSHSQSPETQLQTDATLLPETQPPTPPHNPTPASKSSNLPLQNRHWRQAERAQRWGALPKDLSLVQTPQLLWVLQGATVIALFWWMRFAFRFAGPIINYLFLRLPIVNPIPFFYSDPTQLFLITLIVLAIGLPWMVTGILKFFYGLQPLPVETLSAYSPETVRTLQRYCRQRRLPLPQLKLLPHQAPIIFTYGHLPKTACIIASQGLLEQLGEDEIAAIYATQLGQIVHWDFAVMSWGVLLLQIPYLMYMQVAKWVDSAMNRIERPIFISLLQGFGGAIASILYGIYWILQFPLLWLSRWRLFYSDAEAVAITGNPNALIRALLKIAMGVADQIVQVKSTPWLLDGFNFLLPVGYKQALLFSQETSHQPFEEMIAWDLGNPYRRWLVALQAHPLLGDRLSRLAYYARFWRLEPELDLPSPSPKFRWTVPSIQRWAKNTGLQLLRNFKAWPLLPSAVVYGYLAGLVLRGVLWAIGKISYVLYIWQFVWLSQNKQGYLFAACWLICFGLYLLVRVNQYFPDVKPATAKTERDLLKLQLSAETLPPQSIPVRLVGKLLGRRGISNSLRQDLILQTSTGLVKLHHYPLLEPIYYFWSGFPRMEAWIGQSVTVTGWLRRGATPWVDIEVIQSRGNFARNHQPIWFTLIGFAAVAWAAYLIWVAPVT